MAVFVRGPMGAIAVVTEEGDNVAWMCSSSHAQVLRRREVIGYMYECPQTPVTFALRAQCVSQFGVTLRCEARVSGVCDGEDYSC